MTFKNLFAAFIVALLPSIAFAQTTVLDQHPAPVPAAANISLDSELLTQSYAVTGGTLYITTLRGPGQNGQPLGTSSVFVPSNISGGFTRWLNLSDARLDSGIISTIASGQSGTGWAIARTAGSSYTLVGVATSASAVTTKAMWETSVASTYVSGTAIPVVVNANYTGAGTVTAASTTLTLTAYTEVGGVEVAITGITAAQQFTGTQANYTFNIPSSAGLVPGQHITVEVAMLVTTSAGAATGQINAIGLTN